MPLTERGEVVAGYGFGELETGLMKTVSPRESHEKSDAASATRLTAATTDFSFEPRGTAAIATCSLDPENSIIDPVISFINTSYAGVISCGWAISETSTLKKTGFSDAAQRHGSITDECQE